MKLFLVLALCVQALLVAQISAQAPASAPAPGPAGPTNITAILSKGGQFTMFIRLLGSTQETDQIDQQLNNSDSGLTVFAPPDNSFSSLKSGLLNSLSDQQKVELVQFHILPDYMTLTQFQTVSNPLRTQAGNSNGGEYPLNVTSSGNQVNVTTGVVNTTVSGTIYTDGKLAVYQVDQVLLPLAFFRSPAPAPAPVSGKPKKAGDTSDDTDDTDNTATDSSDGVTQLSKFGLNKVVFLVALIYCMAL
ncbi:Fasciclin-like arabinogalactan protein 11 [Bienertia sinuspersici]